MAKFWTMVIYTIWGYFIAKMLKIAPIHKKSIITPVAGLIINNTVYVDFSSK
jgi:hypothetical protein